MLPYPTDKSSLIIQAGMGVGKSKQESVYLGSLAENYGIDRMIVVKLSHRKAFTAQEVKRLNEETGLFFVSHDDVADRDISLSKNPFIVIQYESLHKLMQNWGLHGRKLIVLCDEWNSILRQMESKAGIPGDDMLMFQTLIQFSSHSVFMDACTNVNSIQTCKSFLRDAGKEVSDPDKNSLITVSR
jgi:Origin of replication binding protein